MSLPPATPLNKFQDGETLGHWHKIVNTHLRSLCQIKIGTRSGTACLVGGGLVLTNFHVLEGRTSYKSLEERIALAKRSAAAARLVFYYTTAPTSESSGEGIVEGTLKYIYGIRLDPEAFFACSPINRSQTVAKEALDYALIAIQSNPYFERTVFPSFDILSPHALEPGERAYLIQYPKLGTGRECTLRSTDGTVGKITAYWIHHTAASAGGSSGGILLDEAGRVVALHYKGGIECSCSRSGVCNSAIQISTIVDDLREKGCLPRIQECIRAFPVPHHSDKDDERCNDYVPEIMAIHDKTPVEELKTLYAKIIRIVPTISLGRYFYLLRHLKCLLENSRDYFILQLELARACGSRYMTHTFISIESMHYFGKALLIAKNERLDRLEILYRDFSLLLFKEVEREMVERGSLQQQLEEALKGNSYDKFNEILTNIDRLSTWVSSEKEWEIIRKLYAKIQDFLSTGLSTTDQEEELAPLTLKATRLKNREIFCPSARSLVEELHTKLEIFREQFLGPVPFTEFQAFIQDTFFSLIFSILGSPSHPYVIQILGYSEEESPLPFSSIQWAILIENREDHTYFVKAAWWFEILVSLLGESPNAELPFRTLKEYRLLAGFRMDPSASPGTRSLILPPDQMVSYVEEFLDQEGSVLGQALLQTQTLSSQGDLGTVFKDMLSERLQDDSRRQLAALASAKRSIASFYEETPKELSASLHGIVDALALYFNYTGMSRKRVLTHLVTTRVSKQTTEDEEEVSTTEDEDKREVPIEQTLSVLDEMSATLIHLALDELRKIELKLQFLSQSDHLESNMDALNENEMETMRWIQEIVLIPLSRIVGEYADSKKARVHLHIDLPKELLRHICQKETKNREELLTLLVQTLLRIGVPRKYHRELYLCLSKLVADDLLREVYLQTLEKGEQVDYANQLAPIPNCEGTRRSIVREREQFIDGICSKLLLDSPPFDQERVVQVTLSSEGREEPPKIYYLHPELVAAYIGPDGYLIEDPRYTGSAHTVCEIDFNGLKAHIKQNPFQPTVEYAVYDLTSRIAGKGASPSVLGRIEVNQADGSTVSYPLLFSKTLEGESLENALTEGRTFDSYHLTMMLLVSLLVRLGDGRPSNYIYLDKIISCFDNDQAFVAPLVKAGLFHQKNKAQFLCILFLMTSNPDEELFHLDPEAINAFIQYNPDLIVSRWFESTTEVERANVGLFSSEEKDLFRKKDQDDNRFYAELLLPPHEILGMHSQFFQLITFLTKATQEERRVSSFDLLGEMCVMRRFRDTNKVGLFLRNKYEENFNRQNPKKALRRIKEGSIDRSVPCDEALIAVHNKVPTEYDVKQKWESKAGFTSDQLLRRHVRSHAEIQTDQALRVDFRSIKGGAKAHAFYLCYLALCYEKEEALLTIEFSNCLALNAERLRPFLKKSLRILHLSNCPELESLSDVSNCVLLEELHIDQCNRLVSIGYRAGFLASIAYTTTPLHLPNLNSFSLSRCPSLKSLYLSAFAIEYFHLSWLDQLSDVSVATNLTSRRHVTKCPLIKQTDPRLRVRTDLEISFDEQQQLQRLLDTKKEAKLSLVSPSEKFMEYLLTIVCRNPNITSLEIGLKMLSTNVNTWNRILRLIKQCHLLKSLILNGSFQENFPPAFLAKTFSRLEHLFHLKIDQSRDYLRSEWSKVIRAAPLLRKLELYCVEINEEKAKHYSDAISSLRHLTCLALNQVEGARSFSISKQISGKFWIALGTCKTLQSLDLSRTEISLSEAIPLGEALHQHPNLRHLDLSKCNLCDEAGLELIRSLDPGKIETLVLSQNALGIKSAQALAEFLESNHILKKLDLAENSFRYSMIEPLIDALEGNITLTTLLLENLALIAQADVSPKNAMITKRDLFDSIGEGFSRHLQTEEPSHPKTLFELISCIPIRVFESAESNSISLKDCKENMCQHDFQKLLRKIKDNFSSTWDSHQQDYIEKLQSTSLFELCPQKRMAVLDTFENKLSELVKKDFIPPYRLEFNLIFIRIEIWETYLADYSGTHSFTTHLDYINRTYIDKLIYIAKKFNEFILDLRLGFGTRWDRDTDKTVRDIREKLKNPLTFFELELLINEFIKHLPNLTPGTPLTVTNARERIQSIQQELEALNFPYKYCKAHRMSTYVQVCSLESDLHYIDLEQLDKNLEILSRCYHLTPAILHQKKRLQILKKRFVVLKKVLPEAPQSPPQKSPPKQRKKTSPKHVAPMARSPQTKKPKILKTYTDPTGKRWNRFHTVGDGACAQHATLGSPSSKGYFYFPEGTSSCREDFITRFRSCLTPDGNFSNLPLKEAYQRQIQGIIYDTLRYVKEFAQQQDIPISSPTLMARSRIPLEDEFTLQKYPNMRNSRFLFPDLYEKIPYLLYLDQIEERITNKKHALQATIRHQLNTSLPLSGGASSSSSSSRAENDFNPLWTEGLSEGDSLQHLLDHPHELKKRVKQLEEQNRLPASSTDPLLSTIERMLAQQEELKKATRATADLVESIGMRLINPFLDVLLLRDAGGPWNYYFTHNELIMVAHLYKVNISIYHIDPNTHACAPHSAPITIENPEKSVTIFYTGDHYERMEPAS